MKPPKDWIEHCDELHAIFERFWGSKSALARYVGISPSATSAYVGAKARSEPRATVAFHSLAWMARERRRAGVTRAARDE